MINMADFKIDVCLTRGFTPEVHFVGDLKWQSNLLSGGPILLCIGRVSASWLRSLFANHAGSRGGYTIVSP